jgi:hypothetical protein
MKTGDYHLIVYFRPNWLLRKLFNKKGYKCEYIGSGTVWRTFPDFERCGSFLESDLCGFYKQIKFKEIKP